MRYKSMMLILVLLLIAPTLTAAESSVSYGWGFVKSKNGSIPEIGKYQQLLDKYHSYYLDDSGEKTVYITFDNGYEQGYTDEILDVLKKQEVPAAFFITGHYVDSAPELVKRMVDEGHIIGNHSYHHPDLTKVSKEKMQKELDMLETAVADLTEQDDMHYLRAPRGTFSARSLKWSEDMGYTNVFWSLAYADWKTGEQKGWQHAYDQVMAQMHPGAVVLLHSVSEDNAVALEELIIELKKQGYSFRTLDDLVKQDILPKAVTQF
ncbi:delta-lactam-biosynthetic de-N-acetylase [Terribacillus halophilus]|jgi:peptidoglycan-N-acetylmuramic acid deacetylase|uniref:delta-lactam-biosynthetic de-N-acetylase n=1 Tax=Terribacillus halophilus TaxID=361279 RepID=UPI0009843BD7|nr:delta-lactam-biosynthetic de-N-acetylase [Terribacillus halophilus]